MTIAEEITRIQQAKSDIRASIVNKGVNVPEADSISLYYTYIDKISGGSPTPSVAVPSGIFTGATLPLVYANAPVEQRTFDYNSERFNITISGLDPGIATITGNGTKSVQVIFNEGSYPQNHYYFTITCGNGTESYAYSGMATNANRNLADSENLILMKVPDGYVILSGTTLPYFGTNTSYIEANNTRYYCHQVVSFSFGRSSVTAIGSYFMQFCYSFNQPLTIPSSVTGISSSFLQNCYSFNQPLTIPGSVTSIGNSFLSGCCSFNQPLTIPSSVPSIGSNFMYNCYSFNQPLTIPSSVTGISNNFMYGCYSFNQPLTIPSSVTSISSSFLQNCYSFTDLVYEASVFPTDNNSLSQDFNTKSDATYGTGIKVTGAGTDGLLAALSNRTSSPYRKLYKG